LYGPYTLVYALESDDMIFDMLGSFIGGMVGPM
jgi:hypothetical protein